MALITVTKRRKWHYYESKVQKNNPRNLGLGTWPLLENRRWVLKIFGSLVNWDLRRNASPRDFRPMGYAEMRAPMHIGSQLGGDLVRRNASQRTGEWSEGCGAEMRSANIEDPMWWSEHRAETTLSWWKNPFPIPASPLYPPMLCGEEGAGRKGALQSLPSTKSMETTNITPAENRSCF